MTEEDIETLRLQAFKTNHPEDVKSYLLATSKWFQDRHYRDIEKPEVAEQLQERIDALVKENEKLKAKLAAKSWDGSVDRQGGSFDDWEARDRGW